MYCFLYLIKMYFSSFSNPVLWEKRYLSSQNVFSQLIKLVTIFDYMDGMFVWHTKDKYSSSCSVPFNITHPKEVVLVALAPNKWAQGYFSHTWILPFQKLLQRVFP